MKKYLMLLLLIAMSGLSYGQYGIGVIGGAHGGLYRSSIPGYERVYQDDVLPIGFQAGIGYDWFYLIGKFRKFGAEGQPEIYSTGVPISSMNATLTQAMSYVGMRLYDYRTNVNLYVDIGYCSIQTEEDIVSRNALMEDFEQNTKFNSSGLGITIGLEKPLFKYAAIDAQLEWTNVTHRQAPVGVAGSSPKVGGVLIGLGLNVKISK